MRKRTLRGSIRDGQAQIDPLAARMAKTRSRGTGRWAPPTRGNRARGGRAAAVVTEDDEEITTVEANARVMGVPVAAIAAASEGRTGASVLRTNSLVVQGAPLAGVVVPGTAVDSPQMDWLVAEAAYLHRMCLHNDADADLLVHALRHHNDNLQSGFVPASLYDEEGFYNPIAGRYADVRSPLNCILRKTSAGAVTAYPSWTTATTRRSAGSARGTRRPSINGEGGRSLLAIGAEQEYTLAAGLETVMTFPIPEEGVIDRLILEVEAAAALMQVVNITYDNDPLLPQQSAVDPTIFSSFSWANPSFGFYVRSSHILTVTVRSLAGAAGPWRIAGGFTVK